MVGQRSVHDPDLVAIYQATCDVYLGGGETVIAELAPRMTEIAKGSHRTHTITVAKLAQAYAHAGDPAKACDLIMQTVDAASTLDSHSARAELRRVVPALQRWPQRDDVRHVRRRLAELT